MLRLLSCVGLAGWGAWLPIRLNCGRSPRLPICFMRDELADGLQRQPVLKPCCDCFPALAWLDGEHGCRFASTAGDHHVFRSVLCAMNSRTDSNASRS